MSNIGTIALFIGVAIAGVIVWEIRRAPTVELAAAITQPLNREQPLLSVTEAHRLSDSSATQQILSPELARSTDTSVLGLMGLAPQAPRVMSERLGPKDAGGPGLLADTGAFPSGTKQPFKR